MTTSQIKPSQPPAESKIIQEWHKLAPVRWARYPWLSRIVAALMKPRTPPVLIVSLPRSGSSWIGQVLGSASDSLYLREPIAQANREVDNGDTLLDVAVDHVPSLYRWASDRAFAGVPCFPPHVAAHPYQWKLAGRRARRLVIKEVNPLALPWWLQLYTPKVILLVRHPAAVLLSWLRMGWVSTDKDDLYQHGRQLGKALRVAAGGLEHYFDCRVIVYEELCVDPMLHFHSLYEFAGLRWTTAIEELIQAHSSKDDSDNPYGTYRNSRSKVNAWVDEISRETLTAIKDGYLAASPAWYREETDWRGEA